MNDEERVRITARWVSRLRCECPLCETSIDLSENEEFCGIKFEPGQVMPDKFMGEEVFCTRCVESFILNQNEGMTPYWVCLLVCDCPYCGEYIELFTGKNLADPDGIIDRGEFNCPNLGYSLINI